MLTDFQNYFTIRIRRKSVIILSLKIPPHLKCVATLPCEMSSVLKATIKNVTMAMHCNLQAVRRGASGSREGLCAHCARAQEAPPHWRRHRKANVKIVIES